MTPDHFPIAAFCGPQPTIHAQIEMAERALLGHPENEECPVRHTFSPGLYMRTITMRAGLFVIGAEHLTEHPNIVHTGRALVWDGNQVREIKAPHVFVSAPGVRKVLLIEESMEWSTVHANPDNCRDLSIIEARTIRKTPFHLEHQAMKEKLEAYIKTTGVLA